MELKEENRFFDFEKQRVQTLTLEQLERTHKENDVYGNPLKGIYHYQLINQIIEIAQSKRLDVEIYDMFAVQNKDRNQAGVVKLPQVEEVFGENAVEAHILRRLYANIRIKDIDNDEMTTNLALAFHQKGIQVGFGNMVKVCRNQCMLGRGQYAVTYGEDKVEIPQLLEKVDEWFTNYKPLIEDERQKVEKLKKIIVPAEQLYMIIGMLTTIRVAKDTKRKEIRSTQPYPLNQAQISAFTEDMMMRNHLNGQVTLWDVYNSATELYKATGMDIPMILPQNQEMVKFIEQFM